MGHIATGPTGLFFLKVAYNAPNLKRILNVIVIWNSRSRSSILESKRTESILIRAHFSSQDPILHLLLQELHIRRIISFDRSIYKTIKNFNNDATPTW